MEGARREAAAVAVSCDPRPTAEALVRDHAGSVYNVAYRLTGDPHDAADLTQDVMLRALANLDRYRPGTLDGWLYRITKNLFLDGVRRRRRVRFDPLPEGDERLPASSEPLPEDVVERHALEARLEEALLQLPADFRMAVVLCDVQGLSYEEVAIATGWPLGTVRSRIHRGRRRMRDLLVPERATAGSEGGLSGA